MSRSIGPMGCMACWMAWAILPVYGAAQAPAVPQVYGATSLGRVKTVTGALPSCSSLLGQPPGNAGADHEPDYMPLMRKLGVARAQVEVDLIAPGESGPRRLRITGRLYFKQYDGDDPQIQDRTTLDSIRASGLEAELSRIALAGGQNAMGQPIVDLPAASSPETKTMTYDAMFTSDRWMPSLGVNAFLADDPELGSLDGDAWNGNLTGVVAAIRTKKPTGEHLNRALIWAADDLFDNDAVIRALVRAGANVNGRTGTTFTFGAAGTPVIFVALGSSACNLQSLVRLGADPTARDPSGQTPLEVAKETGETQSVAVLEAAARRQKPEPKATPAKRRGCKPR